MLVEYYALPFAWLHAQIEERRLFEIQGVHAARRDFWHLIPDGSYEQIRAQELVTKYAESIERRLAEEISTHSIAYWYYVYRRLAPGRISPDQSNFTTLLVRQRLEAAFQKYACVGPDRAIGWSDSVRYEEVLSGVPVEARPPEIIDKVLAGPRMPVLTDFGVENLVQLYRCEQLAFELWRCGATLRITSKGAPLVVDHTSDECFYDDRSEELNSLVTNYDSREMRFVASATGTVFKSISESKDPTGAILLARYNVERESAKVYASMFGHHGLGIGADFESNFEWVPFDLRSYLTSHTVFDAAFKVRHGISFMVILEVLMAMCLKMVEAWQQKPLYMYESFQRAYVGPSKVQDFRNVIQNRASVCAALLNGEAPTEIEVDRAIDFLTLADNKKKLISLMSGGPMFFIIPAGDETVLIDFAWVVASLQYLFIGLPLIQKTLKGAMLESFVGADQSALPSKPCKGLDGSSKQIDAAFRIGETLIVAECKANARSIAYERGDLAALNFRRRKFEMALKEVDEKAAWLSVHARGRNYDISDCRAILPVVVTPFKEFMPSLDGRYWIKNDVPRVLMPYELSALRTDPNIECVARECASAVWIAPTIGLGLRLGETS